MKLYRIGCTFSHFGTKETFLEAYKEKSDIVFEVDEFEGTNEEFHSGSFSEIISVNRGETIREVVENYFLIHNSDFKNEYFSVTDKESGERIYTEDDFNFN